MKKTILITGSLGYFGSLLTIHLKKSFNVYGVDIKESNGTNHIKCDLVSNEQVYKLSKSLYPDVIIHSAGLKDINYCEHNPAVATKINVGTTKNLIDNFPLSKIIYISTDYVFDGDKGNYAESDIANPKTVYGKTKLKAEKLFFNDKELNNFNIFRTSAIYDNNSMFINYLTKELECGNSVSCYDNVKYSPTWINDFVSVLKKIINEDIDKKVLHVCGDSITRYEFALNYAKLAGFDSELVVKAYNKNNIYLFKDLSMSYNSIKELIDYRPTPHIKALHNCFFTKSK